MVIISRCANPTVGTRIHNAHVIGQPPLQSLASLAIAVAKHANRPTSDANKKGTTYALHLRPDFHAGFQ